MDSSILPCPICGATYSRAVCDGKGTCSDASACKAALKDRAGGLHDWDCADYCHDDCENDAACRNMESLGGEPPDVYHECSSPEHATLPEHEGT